MIDVAKMRLPRHFLIAAMAAVGMAGLAFAAISARQTVLQRQVETLTVLAQQQNRTLGDLLLGQRAATATTAALADKIAGLPRLAAAAPTACPMNTESAATRTPVPPPVDSPEILESEEKARVLVDAALATGQWTEKNRDDLHALLRFLPLEKGDVFRQQVITALNARQLEIRALGSPF